MEQVLTMTKKNMVVLIDDNEIDNFINKEIIKRAKITDNIKDFTSAVSALEYFESFEGNGSEGQLPDLIFLDINMPVMDGFEFVERFINLQENITENTSIIMLTSSDNPEDMQRVKKYKIIKDYIIKPLKLDKLEEISA